MTRPVQDSLSQDNFLAAASMTLPSEEGGRPDRARTARETRDETLQHGPTPDPRERLQDK